MTQKTISPFHSWLNAIFDAAFVVDENGVITACNQAACNQTANAEIEYSKSQIVGQNFAAFFSPHDWSALRAATNSLNAETSNAETHRAIFQSGEISIEVDLRVSPLSCAWTGIENEFYLLVMRAPSQNNGADENEIVLAARESRDASNRVLDLQDRERDTSERDTSERDTSERDTSERDVNERAKSEHQRAVVLETASRVALDILSNRTGIEALKHIADAARILAGARYAALGVARLDENNKPIDLREFIAVGLTPDEEAVIGTLPRGRGILGLLLECKEPLRIDKMSDHPASVGFPPNHPPMDSFLGVPIRRGETVLGSLYLTNKHGGGTFSQADETAVQALGAHAAIAMYHLHLQEKQRELVRALIGAQEEERRAVAYDLHDGLTQYVMASHAHLEAFSRAHEKGNAEKSAHELDQGLKYLREAVLESRRLINGLRTLALDDLGLAGALEQLLAEERARAEWEIELSHNIAGQRFDKTLETGVYRIAQESLTNARKHAHTPRLRVLVERRDDARGAHLHLEVRDWGAGFNVAEKLNEVGRIGLGGMIERAHLLGGAIHVRSALGEGTHLTATFPIHEKTT